jgi:tetratricopeptide (TPR) repeat protein
MRNILLFVLFPMLIAFSAHAASSRAHGTTSEAIRIAKEANIVFDQSVAGPKYDRLGLTNAIALYSRAIELDPELYMERNRLATAYVCLGNDLEYEDKNLAEAHVAYRAAAAILLDLANIPSLAVWKDAFLRRAGKALISAGDFEEASKYVELQKLFRGANGR